MQSEQEDTEVECLSSKARVEKLIPEGSSSANSEQEDKLSVENDVYSSNEQQSEEEEESESQTEGMDIDEQNA